MGHGLDEFGFKRRMAIDMNDFAVVIGDTTILCDTYLRAVEIIWERMAEGSGKIWEREDGIWVRKINGVMMQATDCLV